MATENYPPLDSKVNVAVVGNGNWGRNHARNFHQLRMSHLYACCDLNENVLAEARRNYPMVKTTRNFDDIIHDPNVDAVVIASVAKTHYALARRALMANKHVLVEKPFTLNVQHARELVALSEQSKKVLMVGHLLKYHQAVEKLSELVQSGTLGEIYYMYSLRVNLGTIRSDENALWSFGPHDISVILHLLQMEPNTVSARGECYLQKGIHDVVFVNLHFGDGKMAQIQLSWLDPHKARQITIVGSRKMVVFNDASEEEKIKIYDKGARSTYENYHEFIKLRSGDIMIPRLEMTEPLRHECQHFLDCIVNNASPRSDGYDGLRVVKVLEAAQRSLDLDGIPVSLNDEMGNKPIVRRPVRRTKLANTGNGQHAL